MLDALLDTPWSPTASGVALAAAGAVTVLGSFRLVQLGDALAERTGWGQALFGAVFFGAVTSLSGIVMTGVAAYSDSPGIAYSNAVGGIVAQTTAIVVADSFYRRANLEHAAASSSNMVFGALLVALLGMALAATFTPDVTVVGVHPASLLMLLLYVAGLRVARAESERPMWQAVPTAETRHEADDAEDSERPGGTASGLGTAQMWGQFALVGLVVATAGWVVATAGESLVQVAGLQAGFVGGVLMGVINALPEAITAVVAVRHGAVTLAIAGILGGNCLDALNLVVGDLAYRGGSLYHAAGTDELFVTCVAVVMTAIVLGGMLVRQTRGLGRVGFEGIVLVALYAGTVAVLAT